MTGYAAYADLFRVGSAILITLVRGYPSGMIPHPLAVPQQKQATQRHGIRDQHHFAMLKPLWTCGRLNFLSYGAAYLFSPTRSCALSFNVEFEHAYRPLCFPLCCPQLFRSYGSFVPNRTPATIRHFHIGRYRSRATLMDWTIWFPSLACIVSERSVAEMLCCKCPCIITRMHFGHISHWSQSNRPWEDFRGLGGHIFAALQPLYPVFNLKHSIFLETTLVRHIIISRRTN